MSDLTITIKKLQDVENGSIVAPNGVIDARTVMEFQSKLNQLANQHITRILVDMDQVRYVNSTGLGCLITLLDALNAEGGKIVLMNLQPKVKVVFEMLGLTSFFRIVQSIDDAISYFRSLSGTMEDTSQKEKIEESVERTAIIEKPAEDTTFQEPKTVICKNCRSQITIKQPGLFKCPRCFTIFNYIGPTNVVFLSNRDVYPIQLTLNYSSDAIDGLASFVKKFTDQINVNEHISDKLIRSITDTTIKLAYNNDENNIFQVEIVKQDSEIQMNFIDSGDPMESVMFDSIKSLVHKFEIRPHIRKGNIVSITLKKEATYDTLL